MPVRAVALGASGHWVDDQRQVVCARGVVEGDGRGVEVDRVGDVVPDAGGEVDGPLGGAVGVPL